MSSHEPNWDKPVLLGCAPSSGSTLLSVMLDAHPDILCGPELSLFSHPYFWLGDGPDWARRLDAWLDPAVDEQQDPAWEWCGGRGMCPYVRLIYEHALEWYEVPLAQVRAAVSATPHPVEVARTIFAPQLTRRGKTICAEKSPPNIYALKAFLQRYPQGRGIVIVRDGRDVICSLLRRGWEFWRAAATWLVETALARALARHPRVRVLRYEDLVADAAKPLTDLCDFLGVAGAVDQMTNYTANSARVHNDPSILMTSWQSRPNQPIQSASVGRWRKELTPAHLSMLAAARVLPGVDGLEDTGGAGFIDVLQYFNYSPEGLDAQARDTDILDLMQASPPPAVPPPFPLMHVQFNVPTGRQMLNHMLLWSWNQINMLSERNQRLDKLLAVKEKEIADLTRLNTQLQFRVWCKSGKLGSLREFMGLNRKLEDQQPPRAASPAA